MANQNAKIDDNRQHSLLAVTDDLSAELRRILVDPISGRLKVSANISGFGGGGFLFFGAQEGVMLAPGTFYLVPGTSGSAITVEAQAGMVAPVGGTLNRLFVDASVNSYDQNTIITVRINGVPSALTTTLAATVTTGNDVTNNVVVSPGDVVTVQVDSSASGVGTLDNVRASITFAPTSGSAVTGSGSPGQVTFWDTATTIFGDNFLFWNNTDKALGLGTNSDVLNFLGFPSTFQFIQRHDDTYPTFGGYIQETAGIIFPLIGGAHSEGTLAAPTIASDSDITLEIFGLGFDGATNLYTGLIDFQVDGTPGLGSMPGRIVFNTTPTGSGVSLERMRIDSLGRVGIGTSAQVEKLQVEGNFRINTGSIIYADSNLYIHSPAAQVGAFYAGINAGNQTAVGVFGTGVGQNVLVALTTGDDNAGFGFNALNSNTSGNGNTGVGTGALQSNITGDFNVALGGGALNNSNASNNIGIGVGSLSANTSGFQNIAIGKNAGITNVTGNSITLIGYLADVGVDGLTNATAIGTGAIVGASNSLILGATGGGAVNVGISTTTPDFTLEIAGTTSDGILGLTGTSTNVIGVNFAFIHNPSVALTTQALRFVPTIDPGMATTTVIGLNNSIGIGGTSSNAITNVEADVIFPRFQDTYSGTVTNLFSLLITDVSNLGTGTPTLTNQIGIQINNQTFGTNNWAIRTFAGNVTFNEGGDANTDFRVEGDTDVNLLFVDASTNRVGIGTSVPASTFQINGLVGTSTQLFDCSGETTNSLGWNLTFTQKASANIQCFRMVPVIDPQVALGSAVSLNNTPIVGGTSSNNITSVTGEFIQATITGGYNGTIGSLFNIFIGDTFSTSTGTPVITTQVGLEVANLTFGTNKIAIRTQGGGGVIFNDQGTDADVRMEGDTDPNLFFLDASRNNIGMGTLAPAVSALLDLTSTVGALLLPRMTTTQRDALTAVNGMVLYNSTANKFQGYEAGAWVNLV